MSEFKNVTDTDLEVQVDGHRFAVAAGGTFTVSDEFDSQLTSQPFYELVGKKKNAASTAPTEGDN